MTALEPASAAGLDGGRYSLEGRTRVSAEADSYDAHDHVLDRPVTLSIEHERTAADPTLDALYAAALTTQAGLPSQPGLPRLLDGGAVRLSGCEVRWTVSERTAGTPVDLCARPAGLSDEEWAELVLAIAWQLSATLAAVHAAGMVHGRIGPDTVLIAGSEPHTVRVSIVDPGPQPAVMARLAGGGRGALAALWSHWSQSCLYPAPEIEAGHPPTPRSDVYGFGCALAALVADRPEPGWEELLTPSAHVDVAGELRDLAETAMQVRPAERPYSFRVVAERLEAILDALEADRSQPGAGAELLERAVESELPPDLIALLAWFGERVPAAWLNRIPGWRRLADRAGLPSRNGRGRASRRPGLPPARRPADAAGAARVQRTWVVVLSIALIAGGAAAALYAHFSAADAPPASAPVPAVAGLSPQQAATRLQHAGFALGGRYGQHSEQAVGRVTGTDPGAGAHAARGTAVVLLVSTGPDSVPVPKLAGLARASAEAALQAAGLAIGAVSQRDGGAAAGEVLSSNPSSGDAARGSAVDLVIASGQQRIPSGLVGTDQESAVAALHAAGFVVAIGVADSTSAPSGQVLAVSPGGGMRAAVGSTVQLTVSQLVTPSPTRAQTAPAPSHPPSSRPAPTTTVRPIPTQSPPTTPRGGASSRGPEPPG